MKIKISRSRIWIWIWNNTLIKKEFLLLVIKRYLYEYYKNAEIFQENYWFLLNLSYSYFLIPSVLRRLCCDDDEDDDEDEDEDVDEDDDTAPTVIGVLVFGAEYICVTIWLICIEFVLSWSWFWFFELLK